MERKKKRIQKKKKKRTFEKEETNVERMTEGTDILSDEKVLGPFRRLDLEIVSNDHFGSDQKLFSTKNHVIFNKK